jgi:hypothetical protein
MQVVLPARSLEWTEIDLQSVAEPDQQQRIIQIMEAERQQSFDLAAGQLLRLVLIRTRNEEWQMVWSTHHLLIDGWSWPVIFDELSKFYAGTNIPSKPRPYRDFISWIQNRSTADAQCFWREYLKDFTPQPLRIGECPAASSPAGHSLFGEEASQLEESVTQALQNSARENQLTLNTILHGAWALLLAHYQSSANPVFGAAYSGRPAELSGIEGMVGPCVNNLPIRVKITSDMQASTWLQQLQNEQFEASQHQYSSIDQIQEWSGIPWRYRLFDSLIVFQNYTSGDGTMSLSGNVTAEVVAAPESTNYPLTLTVVPRRRLQIKVLYHADQFEAANIRRILSDLTVLIRRIAETPNAALSELLSHLAPPPAVSPKAIRPAAPSGAETTPRSEMERTVAEIWQELFCTPRINLDANFFELGGHSLLLVQAHRKLQEILGRSVPIVTLLQHPTVRALARQLAGDGRSQLVAQSLNERARRQKETMARMTITRKR